MCRRWKLSVNLFQLIKRMVKICNCRGEDGHCVHWDWAPLDEMILKALPDHACCHPADVRESEAQKHPGNSQIFFNKYSQRSVNYSLTDWKSNVKANSSFTSKIIFILKICTLGVNISMKSLGFFSKFSLKAEGFSLYCPKVCLWDPTPAKQSLTHLVNFKWHLKCHNTHFLVPSHSHTDSGVKQSWQWYFSPCIQCRKCWCKAFTLSACPGLSPTHLEQHPGAGMIQASTVRVSAVFAAVGCLQGPLGDALLMNYRLPHLCRALTICPIFLSS